MDSKHASFDSQLVVAPLDSKPAYHPPPPPPSSLAGICPPFSSLLLPQAGSFAKGEFHWSYSGIRTGRFTCTN